MGFPCMVFFCTTHVFGVFWFCDLWTIFMMMTSYLQIPEEFPLPLPPALLQQHHLPAYKYSWLRHVKITITIFFSLYNPYLKWNTYHKSTVWIKSQEYKIESTKLFVIMSYTLVHNCQNKFKQDIKIFEASMVLLVGYQ